jgi:uncharacterized surface protein with fasciclin (FAS1) repeats
MKRSIHGLLCFLSVTFFFSACQKKDWDEYYGRPANLAPPIYQQLQAKGNFTNLLAVIEKAGYKDILGKAGAWTFFAPNDEAFKVYFQEKGISGVDGIDLETARKISTYGLVYNPYRKDQLSSTQTSAGLIPNVSFRRQTAYYDFVYSENGKKVFSNGLNGSQYIATVDNNKYIPYFVNKFVDNNGLTEADYKAFYPSNTYTGFNVANATVVNADIPAENGIIHEVDKVLLPLPNVDQYLASKPDKYSKFKALLDKKVLYVSNAVLTNRYKVLTGSTDSVFVKSYDPNLAFSPVNENYLAVSTDGQTQEWSIAVPTDEVLDTYTAKILKYYGTFDNAPPSVLLNFINSHMWRNVVWPSKLTTEVNSQQEVVTFTNADIVDSKQLSNANFYGINKVQEANVFRTIFAGAYLNPAYALMTRAIANSDMQFNVLTPTLKQTMFLTSDVTLRAAGYNYYDDVNSWGYTAPGASTDYTTNALARINRLVQNMVVTTPFNEFNSLSGNSIAEAFNREYIKKVGDKLYGSGNVEANTSVTMTGEYEDYYNGRAYFTTGVLTFATDNFNLGAALGRLAVSTDLNVKNRYSLFFDYLKNSSLWTTTGNLITGVDVGAFYTLLVPTNAAIQQAVTEGRLPANVLSSGQTAAQRQAVEKFIQYSIIDKNTIAVDGKKAAKYATLLKNAVGDSRLLTVRYAPGDNPDPATMEIVDDTATPNIARPSVTYSNNLCNRALIHSIDKVLKF